MRCEAGAFWRTFFDAAFNERLYGEVLGFPEFAVVEQRETDHEIVRVVEAQPNVRVEIPAAVRSLLGPRFRYTERGRFDKATQIFSFRVVPATLAERTSNEGAMRLEPVADMRWRWITDFKVEASVFGVGRLMESLAEKQLRGDWDLMAACLGDSLARV
jgi:hypothetical protein